MRCFKPLNSSPSLLVCALAGAFACAASAAPAANDVQSIWLAPTGTSKRRFALRFPQRKVNAVPPTGTNGMNVVS